MNKGETKIWIGTTLLFLAGFRTFATILGIMSIWWAVYSILNTIPTNIGTNIMLFAGLAEILIYIGLGRSLIKQGIEETKEQASQKATKGGIKNE